jgi:hypothetical protein
VERGERRRKKGGDQRGKEREEKTFIIFSDFLIFFHLFNLKIDFFVFLFF